MESAEMIPAVVPSQMLSWSVAPRPSVLASLRRELGRAWRRRAQQRFYSPTTPLLPWGGTGSGGKEVKKEDGSAVAPDASSPFGRAAAALHDALEVNSVDYRSRISAMSCTVG